MERRSIEAIVRALNGAGVRYLIAGGLAVVAHGYVRLTVDLDVILDLEGESLGPGLAALGGLGYRPRAPVPLGQFADGANTVFSLNSPQHPATEIALFVEPLLDFERAYSAAARMEIAPGRVATFVGLDDLLQMKRKAGRAVDLEDVRRLSELRGDG